MFSSMFKSTIFHNFIGIFNSVSELKENYPSVIINDYAFIKKYNKKHTKIVNYDKYVYDGENWVYEYSLLEKKKGNKNGK